MRYYIYLIFLLPSLAKPLDKLVFEPFSPHHFKRPLDFIYPNENVAYVVEQRGKIWRLDVKNNFEKTLILNIKDRLSDSNEQGLLSMVLDPSFSENGFIYLYYTTEERAILSRFHLDDKVDLDSEVKLLEIIQPYSNHNGGQLAFGKDGFLYIGVGDGGAAGDILKAGQNLHTLLGKILRIDVSKKSNNKNYSIPTDNPFIGKKGKPEIYAYGFRNPWTFSFDSLTGRLFCADVGQNTKEEVNIVTNGGNYGWSIKEADLIFDSEQKAVGTLIDPIASYRRKEGISITGGVVYRGSLVNSLRGYYLYTDYGSGNLWGINVGDDGEVKYSKKFKRENLRISRFAVDYKKEVYVCSFRKSRIFKIVAVKEKKN